MLAILLATMLMQTPVPPTDEQVEADASQIIAHTEAERRCTELGRPAGESVSACTERRMTLRANGYNGNDPRPFTVTAMRRRCQDGAKTADETLTACIVRVMAAPASASPGYLGFDRGTTASVPRPDPGTEPAPSNCRRRTTSDPEHGSASFSLTCGDPALDQQVNDMLDSLVSSSTPR